MKHNTSCRFKLAVSLLYCNIRGATNYGKEWKTTDFSKKIYYIINGPNIITLAKLLLRTFLFRRLAFVNMKIIISWNQIKYWKYERCLKNMGENTGLMGNIGNMGDMVSVDTLMHNT